MPFHPSDYELHRANIENARRLKIKKKRAEKLAKKRPAALKHYSESALRSELAKRRYDRKMAKMTPEQIEHERQRSIAIRRIKRDNCDHKKHAPKLRKSGPLAGKWACPACCREVPAPKPPGEEIVT